MHIFSSKCGFWDLSFLISFSSDLSRIAYNYWRITLFVFVSSLRFKWFWFFEWILEPSGLRSVCTFLQFLIQIGVIILVTGKQEIERKPIWFSTWHFFTLILKFNETALFEQKIVFWLVFFYLFTRCNLISFSLLFMFFIQMVFVIHLCLETHKKFFTNGSVTHLDLISCWKWNCWNVLEYFWNAVLDNPRKKFLEEQQSIAGRSVMHECCHLLHEKLYTVSLRFFAQLNHHL